MLAHPKGDDLNAESIAMACGRCLAEGFAASAILVALGNVLADRRVPPKSWGSYVHSALSGMKVRGEARAEVERGRARPRPSPEIAAVEPTPDDRRTSELRRQNLLNQSNRRAANPRS